MAALIRIVRVCVVAITVVGAVALTTPSSLAGAAAKVTVSPTTGLTSGQHISVSVAGEPPNATLLALECVPAAVSIGEDGCENRVNQVFFSNAKGRGSASLSVSSTITTADGVKTCFPTGCLVAVVQLNNGNSISIQGIAALSFVHAGPAPSTGGPPTPPTWPAPTGVVAESTVTPGSPAHLSLQAGVAGDLSGPGVITGPGTTVPTTTVPTTPVMGVGLVQLVMDAPGTSWASASDTAAVVNVKVGTQPRQQIVLFAGARPFTYAAVFDTMSTGGQPVTISVSRPLSSTGSQKPTVQVIAASLSIVTSSNPAYLAMAYAPLVYGRPGTATSDTPLLTSVQVAPGSGATSGDTHLTYTTIWTKEDAGTSFVPWLEWGEWGRMTDITETTQLDVTPSGAIVNPMYDSCGCTAGFPVERTSPKEVEVPFTGKFLGTHMVIRNASGNDYQVQSGTSPFALMQAPIPGASAGQARETVMDANPWTYRISADELSRWYADGSTNPNSPEIGDTRQYALVDVSTDVTNVSAVGVEIQLNGSSTWYSDDHTSGYLLYGGGHARTAVKLPLSWLTTGIAAIRLVAYPSSPGATPSVTNASLTIRGLDENFNLVTPTIPTPSVVLGGS